MPTEDCKLKTANWKLVALFEEVHIPVSFELPEEWIGQVIDKLDGFSGALHFRAEALVHIRELVKREDRDFDGITFQLLFETKIFQLMRTQHDLGGNIEIRNLIGFGNKWSCPGCAGIGFDDIDFFFCTALGYPNSKLDVDQTSDIEGESNFPGIFNHLIDG